MSVFLITLTHDIARGIMGVDTAHAHEPLRKARHQFIRASIEEILELTAA